MTQLQPGRNCWRVERADRFRCVADGEEYFRVVRDAILAAQRTVFILGWDIAAGVDLVPGAEDPAAPTRLGPLLDFAARRRRSLQCFVLIWDYAAFYALERDPFSRIRLGWGTHRRVHFRFDDQHPLAGSHHQKVVVVDDRLAFAGGMDLTGHRWDTVEHRVDQPLRLNQRGKPYAPYHEVQAMVDGPVAAALGELARERWRRLGIRRLPPVVPGTASLWPADSEPDLLDVDVAVVRNEPGFGGRPAVRECEALFLDAIASARRTIFVENQYFTSPRLGDAFGARLRERDGPELVVVVPEKCEGWLEQQTMGVLREQLLAELTRNDRHGRLRLLYPVASRAQGVNTFVHSKVMIVDDECLRIGSANLSNRSMSIDSECDLALCAGRAPGLRRGIRAVRDRLVAEHLGRPVAEVARAIERRGSLRAAIDALATGDRTLAPVETSGGAVEEPSAALRAAADPEQPAAVTEAVDRLLPEIEVQHELNRKFSWILPVCALAVPLLVVSDAHGLQRTLARAPDSFGMLAAALLLFVACSLLFAPLELLLLASVAVFGPLHGGALVLAGTLLSALLGYLAGRSLGLQRLVPLIGRRAYRLSRLVLGRGVVDVAMPHLVAVASHSSIHLLCGAAPVGIRPFVLGTLLGTAPAMLLLGLLGGLLRSAVLRPGPLITALTLGLALVLVLVALRVRSFLLMRCLAGSMHRHEESARFG